MTSDQPTTFQDLLKRKRQKLFVGRQDYLTFFEKNLVLSVDDERRQSIFNIYGQAGVGKTSLIERFRRLADNTKAITALVDESHKDIPSVLEHVAREFEQRGHTLKKFKDRYKVYRQRRQELEAEPDMPKGLSAIAGRAVVKTGFSFVRSAPLGSVIAELIDEDSLATQLSEWGMYVARKLKDKEEVLLLRDPVAVLTPLVIEAFRDMSEESLIVLFFDTYERTDALLSPWLNDLMMGRYGDLPVDVIFVIAGQHELDRNKWAAYEGLIHRIALEPFTEAEARDYISRQGIVDEKVVETILAISGRLPLLVATLAAESPKDPGQVGNPTGLAIIRFLKWVDTDQQRQLALDAAIPRKLNRDVLQIIGGSDTSESNFSWLKEMPFVQERYNGWIYHDVVRSQMLRHKRSESPQGWFDIHGRLAGYYNQLKNDLAIAEDKAHLNLKWRQYALEDLYHSLCRSPEKELSTALNGFIKAYSVSKEFASEWAETVLGAGQDSEASELLEWGARLVQSIKTHSEFDPNKAFETYTSLIGSDRIEDTLRGELYYRRGDVSLILGNFEDAIEDFDRALVVMPSDFYCWLARGLCNFTRGHFDQSKDDLLRARQLDPESKKPPVLLACIYYYNGQKREAIETLNQASILSPQIVSIIALAIELMFSGGSLLKRLVGAQDFSKEIHASIRATQELSERTSRAKQLIQSSVRGEVSLSDFIQEASNFISVASPTMIHGALNIIMKSAPFMNAVQDEEERGVISERLESLVNEREALMSSINMLTHIFPVIYTAVPYLVMARCALKRYEDALFILDNASQVYPNDPKISHLKTAVYNQQGIYEEALASLDEVIKSSGEDASGILSERGLVLTYLGRYAEAVETYRRALRKEPDSFALLYNLAVAVARLEGNASAEPYLVRAREVLESLLESSARPLALYGLGGLEALLGNYEEALNKLQEAVHSDKNILEFAGRDVAWLDLQTDERFKRIIDSNYLDS
ncbi:MAG: tetratricopeptide repeat protein [Acidobacteria bacterium]|nr:tetratricopeptide repeat protein [Acidobacteriota bacterium]